MSTVSSVTSCMMFMPIWSYRTGNLLLSMFVYVERSSQYVLSNQFHDVMVIGCWEIILFQVFSI